MAAHRACPAAMVVRVRGAAGGRRRRGEGVVRDVRLRARRCSVGRCSPRASSAPPRIPGHIAAVVALARRAESAWCAASPSAARGTALLLERARGSGANAPGRTARSLTMRRHRALHDGDVCARLGHAARPAELSAVPAAFDLTGYLARRGVYVSGSAWDEPAAGPPRPPVEVDGSARSRAGGGRGPRARRRLWAVPRGRACGAGPGAGRGAAGRGARSASPRRRAARAGRLGTASHAWWRRSPCAGIEIAAAP
jgi:hypothetical protein